MKEEETSPCTRKPDRLDSHKAKYGLEEWWSKPSIVRKPGCPDESTTASRLAVASVKKNTRTYGRKTARVSRIANQLREVNG